MNTFKLHPPTRTNIKHFFYEHKNQWYTLKFPRLSSPKKLKFKKYKNTLFKFRECTTTHIIKKKSFWIYMYHLFDTMSTSFRCSFNLYIPKVYTYSIFNTFFLLFLQCFRLYSQLSSCFFYFFIITCCTTTPLYFPSFLFTNSPSIPFRLKIPFPFITLGIALPSSTIT